MPNRASSSRLGTMFSSGRSTCCSTLISAMPSTSAMADLICRPMVYILFRSVPNTLMAMLDWVPESMASMRCEMGPPISRFTPGSTASFSRISATSWRLLLFFSTKGHSNSEQLTPKACSSSSARPVFRPTVRISGMLIRICSAWRPSRLDSSREMPGTELMAMVKEPSLKAGRKLRPSERNIMTAAISRIPTAARTLFR